MATRVKDKDYIYPAKPIFIPPDGELMKRLSDDEGYVAELKKNGWRCMVRVKPDGNVELWTRHKTLISDALPNIRKLLMGMKLPKDSILDGELMEHRGKVSEELNVFGVIRLGGKWLSTLPYKDIIEIVRDTVKDDGRYIRRVEQVSKGKKRLYKKVEKEFFGFVEKGVQSVNEGIVIKRLDAPVPFGWKNSPISKSWFKVKPVILCDGNS